MNTLRLRRLHASLVVLSVIGLSTQPAVWALFLRPELENVPVQRVITNLEKTVMEKPKDFQARLNLARAHAMAYASKADEFTLNKNQKDGGIWFGFTPKFA